MPLAPLERCWRRYVFELFVHLLVCVCIFANMIFPKLLEGILQIYHFGALRNMLKLFDYEVRWSKAKVMIPPNV